MSDEKYYDNLRRKRRRWKGVGQTSRFIEKKLQQERVKLEQEKALELERQAHEQRLLNERMEFAKKQAEELREKEKQWLATIPFDPLDPVALLEAQRELRRIRTVVREYEPHVEFVNEERWVPVVYGQDLPKMMMDAPALRRQNRDNDKLHLTKEEAESEEPPSFFHQRLILEDRYGKGLVGKLVQHQSIIETAISSLDPKGTGYVDVASFRQVILQHRDLLHLDSREADIIAKELLHGELVNYHALTHCFPPSVPRTGLRRILPPMSEQGNQQEKELSKVKSAADLCQDIQRSITLGRGLRHSHSNQKFKSTSDLLRPKTGKEGFFPESERFLTTKMLPASESVSSIMLASKANSLNVRKVKLESHLSRIKTMQDEISEKARAQEARHLEAMRIRYDRYIRPMIQRKEEDIQLANKPKGKRVFPHKIPQSTLPITFNLEN